MRIQVYLSVCEHSRELFDTIGCAETRQVVSDVFGVEVGHGGRSGLQPVTDSFPESAFQQPHIASRSPVFQPGCHALFASTQ
jgi:hypothetical protein